MPQHINTKTFDTLVINSAKPVVIDVWADWCGPCKMIAPHFAEAERELQGKVRFVKLDADKNQKLLRKYQIMGIPTLLFFKDGRLVDRSTGMVTKAAIVRRAKSLIASENEETGQSGFFRKFLERFRG